MIGLVTHQPAQGGGQPQYVADLHQGIVPKVTQQKGTTENSR
jgi:hypothetical protein